MKQKEGSLQERIQRLIEKKGGYVFKNHGDMTTEPGRPDIVACYKGYFLAIEAKVDGNTPSAAQGIHCRNIWKAGGIACVVWTINEAEYVLDYIDAYNADIYGNVKWPELVDDGKRW